jgi:Protein of unknown function (DUF2892).
MKRNLGNIDISVRFLTALIVYFFAVGFKIDQLYYILMLIIAGYLLFTSFINFCIIYYLLHLDSYHESEKNHQQR